MFGENWRVWDNHAEYGQLLYRRAVGTEPEMESAKAACKIIAPLYRPGDSLLDVGCGAGHYLRSLRNRIDAGINYTGIDATAAYIALAEEAFPITGTFRQGDITALPCDDNEFDIVMCNNVILHLPPPPTVAIKELLRVARRHVVIRTVFGVTNYIIKQAVPPFDCFNYFNIYTEDYFRQIIREISETSTVTITQDNDYAPFDNTVSWAEDGTRCVGARQVSGNLLLDWRFITISKHTRGNSTEQRERE